MEMSETISAGLLGWRMEEGVGEGKCDVSCMRGYDLRLL